MRLCNSTPRAAATALHASVVIAYLDLHVLSWFFLFRPDGDQSSPFHTPFFFVSESSSTPCLSVLCSISLGNRPNTTIIVCDKNSNASSKVELVNLYPCKHTPCVPRLDGTLFSLHIEFIPAEEVRHMDMKLEIGGKHHPWVYPYFKQWVEVRFVNKTRQDVSPDICRSHIANSSCPLKAGAPISMTWPLQGKFEPSVVHILTLGTV